MEIPKVEESNQLTKLGESLLKKGPLETSPKGRKCVYYSDVECTAPNCKYEMCKNCPYGYMCSITSVVKNVYQKIIGLAIVFLNRENLKVTPQDKPRV